MRASFKRETAMMSLVCTYLLLLLFVSAPSFTAASIAEGRGHYHDNHNNHTVHSLYGPTQFMKFAQSRPIVSDKTTTHAYHEMYGLFLLPLIQRKHRVKEKIKMFEIGLGCNFNASSLTLWKPLLHDQDELWMGELSHHCVEDFRKNGRLEGVNIVEGDQNDFNTLKKWAQTIGPNIDIIIDDGSHQNNAICNTFHEFWNALAPGGYYFVEDLVLLKHSAADKYGHYLLEYIDKWNQQLGLWGSFEDRKSLPAPFQLPSRLKWIFCQAEACVFAKCAAEESANCAS